MLENEAGKKENLTNLVTFIAAFTLISIATIMCCYFNYKFSTEVASKVFWLFVLAWFLDMLVFRLIFILIMALLHFCRGKKKGYANLPYMSTKEVNEMVKSALKDMFHVRPKKETPGAPTKPSNFVGGDENKLEAAKTRGHHPLEE